MFTREWLIQNWFTVLSVAVYLLANVVPRPSGEQMHGPLGAFWRLLDRLCILTAKGLPGSLKAPLESTSTALQASQAAQAAKQATAAQVVPVVPVAPVAPVEVALPAATEAANEVVADTPQETKVVTKRVAGKSRSRKSSGKGRGQS